MTPTVAFVSQKGGVGKSAITWSLAWELQERHGPVLVVDMDPQASLLKQAAHARGAGLAPPAVMGADLDVWRTLPKMAKDYWAVLIDTPGRSDDVQRAAMMAADLAIIPVVYCQLDTDAVQDTLKTVAEGRRAKRGLRAAIVLNQQLPRTELAERARKDLDGVGVPVMKSELYTRSAWRYAMNSHVGVAQYARSSQAAVELRALANEVERMAGKGR